MHIGYGVSFNAVVVVLFFSVSMKILDAFLDISALSIRALFRVAILILFKFSY